MQAYENGGHAYHATMPTDCLIRMREVMAETRDYGHERSAPSRWSSVRASALCSRASGIKSVAAPGFRRRAWSSSTPTTRTPSSKVRRAGPSDRGRRAAAVRRAGGLRDLPAGPVRPGQAPRRGPHREVAGGGARQGALRPAWRSVGTLRPHRILTRRSRGGLLTRGARDAGRGHSESEVPDRYPTRPDAPSSAQDRYLPGTWFSRTPASSTPRGVWPARRPRLR